MTNENPTLKRARFNAMFGQLTVYAQMQNTYFIHSNDSFQRTAEQQNELFKQRKSKCDGYERISKHQEGLARDLYIVDKEGKFVFDREPYELLGKYWEGMGNTWEPIPGDIFHFEI